MRPAADRLRELRGDRNLKDVAAEAGVDWRTLASFETGDSTDRFQYNTINFLAAYYEVPFDQLIEPIPAGQADQQLRRRAMSAQASA